MPLPYPIERLKNIEDCRTVMRSLLKRGDIATYVQVFTYAMRLPGAHDDFCMGPHDDPNDPLIIRFQQCLADLPCFFGPGLA